MRKIKKSCYKTIFFLICSFMIPGFLYASNSSDLNWRTIPTEHFAIHYHDGEEWSAARVALIAEEIYDPVTDFYNYKIDKVHINLMDTSDRPGGAAYYYQNRINIDVSAYEFALRGTANWLRNVTTHEFTHLVSIQKGMKMPRSFPSVYFQIINFEKEKRPDVITGYPNFYINVPFAGVLFPNWFAEGVAQSQVTLARNDIWDSHRDMILRMATLNDRLLTMDEMGVFGKNSLNSELLYNQGFSLVNFIAKRYGREKIRKLVEAQSKFYRIAFDGACKDVLGISANRLYQLWKQEIEKEYAIVKEEISKNQLSGEEIAGEGFLNMYPISDIKGGIYFLSNRGRDFSGLDLVYMKNSGQISIIAEGVTSRFSLSGDEKKLCYSKITSDNGQGNDYNDLFIYNITTGRETRLTKSLRTTDPEWSPDDKYIVTIMSADCSEKIAIMDIEKREVRELFRVTPGVQYFDLSWGRGGILASRFDCASRDIVLFDPERGSMKEVVATLADERDPVWDKDGEGFFYSSDRTGIFNIYHHIDDSFPDILVTNVLGGAFAPDVSGDTITYQGYEKEGYKISRIACGKLSLTNQDECVVDSTLIRKRKVFISDKKGKQQESFAELRKNILQIIKENKENESTLGATYTQLYFFPSVMIYEHKPRLGLTMQYGDILDRQSVITSASVNKKGEYDLALGFELQTRRYFPTFNLEFYRSRKYYNYYNSIEGNVDIRYDLWDAFFTLSYELSQTTAFRQNKLMLRYNYGEYGLNINAWDQVTYEMGWSYYKGSEISLLYAFSNIKPGVNADINPRRGRRLFLEATMAHDKLFAGDFVYMFMPDYADNNFGRYLVTYEEFIPLPFFENAISIYTRAGVVDNAVDDFLGLYLGSRDGLRGYSYYSLGGKKIAMGRVTYRFPLMKNINKQFLFTYLGSLYGGLFAEAGNAWNEDKIDFDNYKTDVGFELRGKGFNFYNYPLAVSFEAAYGLDDVKYKDPFTETITFYEGKSWKYYGSVSYGF
ncbi:PD40 domain-containing protein [bacterium]|nr:PD40 domain-containing protein [bacterium]